MKRHFIIFTGRVQGVGFRYFAYQTALNLSLTGHVRNLQNGQVACEVQGSEEALGIFLRKVLRGNGFLKVEDYALKELPPQKEERTFHIDA
ncbi:MAG TPA: acylphosphatase [Clostridiaceae bacterium]|nr:acylphosphatase [Clostridiaceae bacterium]